MADNDILNDDFFDLPQVFQKSSFKLDSQSIDGEPNEYSALTDSAIPQLHYVISQDKDSHEFPVHTVNQEPLIKPKVARTGVDITSVHHEHETDFPVITIQPDVNEAESISIKEDNNSGNQPTSSLDSNEFPIYSWNPDNSIRDGTASEIPSHSPNPTEQETDFPVIIANQNPDLISGSSQDAQGLLDQNDVHPISDIPSNYSSRYNSQESIRLERVSSTLTLDRLSVTDSQGWVDVPENNLPQPRQEDRITKKSNTKKRTSACIVEQSEPHSKDLIDLDKLTRKLEPLLRDEDEECETELEIPVFKVSESCVKHEEWNNEELALLEEVEYDVMDSTPPDVILDRTHQTLDRLLSIKAKAMESQKDRFMHSWWYSLVLKLSLTRIVHGYVSWESFDCLRELMDYYLINKMKDQASEHALDALDMLNTLGKPDPLRQLNVIQLLATLCERAIETQSVFDAKTRLKRLLMERQKAHLPQPIEDRVRLIKAKFANAFGSLTEAIEAYSVYFRNMSLNPGNLEDVCTYAQLLIQSGEWKQAIQLYTDFYHSCQQSTAKELTRVCIRISSLLLDAMPKSQAALKFSHAAVAYAHVHHQQDPSPQAQNLWFDAKWLQWNNYVQSQHYQEAMDLAPEVLLFIRKQLGSHSKRELDFKVMLALCKAALGRVTDALDDAFANAKHKKWIQDSKLILNPLMLILRHALLESNQMGKESSGVRQDNLLGTFLRQHSDFKNTLNVLLDSRRKMEFKHEQSNAKAYARSMRPMQPKPPANKPLDNRPRWRYP